MRRKKIIITIAILIGILFLWIFCKHFMLQGDSEEYRLRSYVDEHRTWAISNQQFQQKGAVSQYEATETFLYLAYSQNSCVEVYNHYGDFQYTILVPDQQNGGVSIRCVGDYLYISDKSDTVYVFDGRNEIDRMEPEEARNSGFDYFWFMEKGRNQKIADGFLVVKDEQGVELFTIRLPTSNSNVSLVNVLAFLIVYGAYYVYIKTHK